MGFPQARAMRALYYSGNSSLDDALNWIVEHENDADIDELPLVDVDIEIESSEPFPVSEEIKRAEQLRDENRKRKEEEEKKLQREREKERIQAGKNLLEAKRIAEQNERKRNLALRKAEKEQEKRAREKVRQKLEQDKLNRRSMLGGNPQESHAAVNSSAIRVQEERNSKPVYKVAKTDHLSNCLRSLKRNHKGEDARVRRAFQTLLIYVGNVVKNPNEEKYRKIRLSNPVFQDRVGSLKGGVEFLELCGFERVGEFLCLPHEKVDTEVLKSAGSALNTAITNPFFGLLST
ncbi:hypothetical protein L6164_003215 [Bauhinia variegata]|uniref:Uncharacterized protein n=1 Tax=Bauhinia variegata TaxID=167791 RepID=A0ACB9Q169_BAUVA|nr:hypothetical protein L6164_003215 [Bauhinia variegata]